MTRTTSPRAIRPARLGELVAEYFGEDRVTVVNDLPDALVGRRYYEPSPHGHEQEIADRMSRLAEGPGPDPSESPSP